MAFGFGKGSVARRKLGAVGGGGGGAIALRGSNINYINVASYNAPIPAGAVAGDLMFLFYEQGYPLTSPSGWTVINNTDTGAGNVGGFYKLLSSTDISNGTIALTFGGAFDGVVIGAVMNGPRGGIRATAYFTDSNTQPVTNSSPVAGDYALYVGTFRGNNNATVNAGTLLQTSTNTAASGVLYGGVLATGGVQSPTFTYGTNTCYYKLVVVVIP